MDLVLKILGGRFGGALLTAAGVAVAMMGSALAVQSWRLDRAVAGRATAEAALINPATGKTWRAEALRDHAALGVCTTALRASNDKVADWQREGARLAAAAREAGRQSQAARAVAASRSEAVLAATIDAKTCEAGREQLLALAREVVK